VPNTSVPLYFLGSELVYTLGGVPLTDGTGIFHCVSSYNGTFYFGFTVNRDIMPDPEDYNHHIEQSIADHLAAAASSPVGAE